MADPKPINRLRLEHFRRLWYSFRRLWYSFKKRKTSFLGLFIVLALFFTSAFLDKYAAPYPNDDHEIHPGQFFQPPSWEHLCGTDELGRDVLSRIILGTKISLLASLEVTALALVIGTLVGLVSGYRGGNTDLALTKLTEIFQSVPSLVLALVVVFALGRSLSNAIIAIAIVGWPSYARLVRGEVLHIKQEAYIEAARSIGAGTLHMAFKEILPNLLTPLVIRATLGVGGVLLTLASLGFLGLGAQPPTPEWGTIVSSTKSWLPKVWWPAAFAGGAIFVAVFGFNLFGEGLKDALTEA